MADRLPDAYEFGEFRLDPRRRLLEKVDGTRVAVTAKALDTLVHLVAHAGRVLDKDDLMAAVWLDATVEENNLNQAVSTLRRALGDARDAPRYIATVPGRGYQFVAEVRSATPAGTEAHIAAPSAQSIDEVARAVVAALTPHLPSSQPRPASRGATGDPVAREHYLKGRFHLLRMTQSGIDTGVQYFENAIARDPGDALAHVGLAHAHRMYALSLEMDPGEVAARSGVAAARAVELDPSLAEAHAVLGFHRYWFDWDWSGAEAAFRRALELDPDSVDTQWMYAHVRSNAGLHEDALALMGQARALDPSSSLVHAMEGQMLLHAGRVDEALVRLREAIQLEPRSRVAHLFAASACLERGLCEEALLEARQARALTPVNTQALALEASAQARLGRPEEAAAALAQLRDLATSRFVSPYHIALACHGVGDTPGALTWLERGLAARDPKMVFVDVDPAWRGLRGDSRFAAVSRQMAMRASPSLLGTSSIEHRRDEHRDPAAHGFGSNRR